MRFDIRAGAARGLGAAFLGLLLCGPLLAQPSDQYSDDDIRQTVARVSYLNGGVSYARGDDPDTWQAADLNVPLTLGDRIYTGRGGRAELAVQGGAHIRLDADTDLEALNLTDDTQQFSLKVGAASFQLLRLGQDDIFEVDTPNAAITFDAAGEYRIDVDADGNSRILVRRGRALVAAGGGQVTVGAGDEMDVNGLDDPRYDMVSAGALDGFDRWCSVRVARVQRSRSRQYVNEDIVGVADLDDSGTWEDVPEYGHVWSPARVAADWTPYRDGHWVWQDPWGWTWISTESWGWAPYHYGRWVTARSRWFWVPDAPRTYSRYSPALVAFVGGGGGGAFVGWFPLAPRDPFIPWWGGRRSAAAVTNVTYVNRNHVTIVRQDAFVSGGLVARSIIRDQAVVRGVVAAPVLRGTLPFVPTQASLRVAIRPGLPAAPRPPAAIAQRAVVARIAPPPAPPSFSSKLTVIRENRGAPVAAAAAARIVEQRGPTPQSVSRIRPAASDQGRVTLAPGTVQDRKGRPAAAAPAVQPVPIAPVRGRELATTSRPVAPVAPGGDVRRVERGREPVAQPPTGQPPAGQPAVGKPPVGQPPAGQPPAGQPSAADRQRDADRQRLQQQQQQQQQQKQQQENTRQRQEQERSKVQQPPAQDPKAIQQQQQQQQQKQQQDERQRVLEQQRQQDQQKQQQELKQQQQQQQQQEERRKTLEQQRQQQQEQRQQEQRQRVQSPPPTQPPSDGQDQQKRRELDRQRQQQEQQQKQQQQQQPPPPPAERQRREPPAERPGQPPAQQPPAQPPAAAREDRGRQPEAKKPAEKPKDDKAKKDDKKKKDDQDKKDEKKNR